MRHPLGAHLSPTPGRPAYVAATTDGQEHRRASHLRSGCTKPGQTPRVSTHSPPIHALPHPRSDPRDVDDVSMVRADRGSSIAPTGLKCPEGSRPTARRPPPPPPERRSRQDTSPADAPAASGYNNQSSIWIQDLWGSLGVLDTLGGEGGGGSRAREIEPFHERRRNRDRERAPTETS